MRLIKIIFLAICTKLPQHIKAQVGITAVPLLEVNGDARIRGLAGADVAKISHTVII